MMMLINDDDDDNDNDNKNIKTVMQRYVQV